MNDTRLQRAAVAALLGAALACAGVPAAAQGLPTVQKVGDIDILSGGIDKDESTAFKAEARSWPLAMEFSVTGGERAQFASDVAVNVRDASGRSVLQTTSTGPFLLARLPPGTYTVEAALQGVAKRQQVTVRRGASSRVAMSWPASVGDARP